jgi:hypothetical protein
VKKFKTEFLVPVCPPVPVNTALLLKAYVQAIRVTVMVLNIVYIVLCNVGTGVIV